MGKAPKSQLGLSRVKAHDVKSLATLLALILTLPLAALSDRIGRRPLLIAGRVRYSGFGIGYNVCVAIFGGTTPHVVTWLTAHTGNMLAPAFYIVVAALISMLTVLTLRETAGRPRVVSGPSSASAPRYDARRPPG